MALLHASRQIFTQAVIRVAAQLGLTRTELADILGLAKPDIDKILAGNKLIDPQEPCGTPAIRLIAIFQSLRVIVADDEQSIRSWLRSPNLELGSTPLALMMKHDKLEQVIAYLENHLNRT